MTDTTQLAPFRLADLERIITRRALTRPEGSYTAKLLAEGMEKCAKKVVEEAGEFALAATAANADKAHTVGEAADLLYHTLVVLHARGITLNDVYAELRIRHEQMSDDPKSNRRGT